MLVYGIFLRKGIYFHNLTKKKKSIFVFFFNNNFYNHYFFRPVSEGCISKDDFELPDKWNCVSSVDINSLLFMDRRSIYLLDKRVIMLYLANLEQYTFYY
jgi:hypothetical protein